MRDYGTIRPGTTLYIPFATYDSNDPTASVTMTGLAVTDIEIYKDGNTTQRGSDNGYTLLDTDGIDFDGITGIHGFSINLADNSTAGFYAAGSQYWVVVSAITVDAGTISFIAATFQIGYPDAILNTTIATLASQTSFTLTNGPADNNALVGCVALIHDVASAVQIEMGVVSAYTGSTKTVTLAADPGVFTAAATDNIAFYFPINTRWLSGTAQTGRDIGASVLLSSGTGTGQVSLSSGTVTAGTVSDKTGYSLTATTGLGNQTANITGNLSGSVGSVTGAVGSVTGTVGSVTGNVGGSVATVAANGITATSIATDAINAASVKADAVTKIQTGLATPTNITAGTITNLTNAPTNGDLTSTMKTSVTTAATAATPTAAAVTGNVGGNVVGSVGSVTAEVDANITSVNGITVDGSGTTIDPWGPA